MEANEYVDEITGEIKQIPVIVDGESFVNNGDTDITVTIKVPPGQSVKPRKRGSRPHEYKDVDSFVKVFQDQIQQMIVKGELSDDEKSVLFTLIFFISGYDGSIKFNGDDMNVKKLFELLKWKKIDRLYPVLKSLEAKGIIKRIKDGNKALIRINPLYMCRGNATKRTVQIKTFNMKKVEKKETNCTPE